MTAFYTVMHFKKTDATMKTKFFYCDSSTVFTTNNRVNIMNLPGNYQLA